jgi:hypothetical protein
MAIEGEQSELKAAWLEAREAWMRCAEGKELGDLDQKFKEMVEADRAYRLATRRRNGRRPIQPDPPGSPFDL